MEEYYFSFWPSKLLPKSQLGWSDRQVYEWVYVNKIQTLYICARYLFIEGLDFFCDFGSQPAAHIEELKSIGIAMQPVGNPSNVNKRPPPPLLLFYQLPNIITESRTTYKRQKWLQFSRHSGHLCQERPIQTALSPRRCLVPYLCYNFIFPLLGYYSTQMYLGSSCCSANWVDLRNRQMCI